MFSWQAAIITYLILSHISGSVFSIYVHRGLGHHYFDFKPALAHVFRFWLWFGSGHCWPNWMQHYAAKHRKHHVTADTPEDPHSPFFYSFLELIDVSHNDPKRANYITPAEIQKFAPDIKTADDWIERNVYCKYPKLGLVLFALMMTLLFGPVGIALGLFNYYFIGHFFIFFGNYAFHKFGWTYATTHPVDKARIFCPWAIFSGGEELHAHHHNDPTTPHYKRNWWELDIGWQYSRILMALGLMSLHVKDKKNV